ncbi:fimbrial protein [Acinetobacter courvalinii]|uniref:fimbrial protein n=1 Tax=Acinetobacter courvalinii TaxID=280147 RepID=UPI0021CDF92B|nr:fimbrial protein [Acinetobacter courvalinii]MCU4639190.1 type 1 fimbrial protein [Acinetobacter courvalinii]
MKKLNLGLAVLAFGAASTAFATPTGTIDFTGTLLDGTCAATLGSTTNPGGDVTLPIMHINTLNAKDQVAGDTPFIIKLTGAGCSATVGGATKIATPYFEADPTKVNAAGRLINADTSTDGAKNIDIQLLTENKTKIDLNEPANTQITATGKDLGSNVTDFQYFARYYATDAAEKGKVAASVSYSILYK